MSSSQDKDFPKKSQKCGISQDTDDLRIESFSRSMIIILNIKIVVLRMVKLIVGVCQNRGVPHDRLDLNRSGWRILRLEITS